MFYSVNAHLVCNFTAVKNILLKIHELIDAGNLSFHVFSFNF